MNATHTPESWLPVVGWEGRYEVSDQGRVRNSRTGHVLKPWLQKGGYPTVGLGSGKPRFRRAIHSLVLEAFVGPRPAGMDACHGDGNPLNNTLGNLRWDTRGGNMRDAVEHGTHNHARKTHCIHGHEFTPENTRTYTFPNGVVARFCRACKRNSNLKYRKAA